MAAEGGGEVDRLRPAEHGDGKVAQAGHDVRAATGAHLGAVFGEGDVADVVQAVLELGARDTAAHARNGLGLAARRQGHFGRARELHLEALSFFQEAGFTEETAHTLGCLGFVEELRGDLDAAEAFHRKSLLVTRELFDELPRAFPLEGLACVAAARQQPQLAAE